MKRVTKNSTTCFNSGLRTLWKNIKVLKVGKYRIYNANQKGLFYNQLPSRTFVKIENPMKARGCKQMKSKERITVMVCTAADGNRVPLLIIGK